MRPRIRPFPWWIGVVGALLVAFLIYQAVLAVRRNALDSSGSIPKGEPARVMRVVDGDTIDVRLSGSKETVRYIGIDTPERVECYYREATAKNAELVAGKEVRLVKDVSETDRYERLLRYVYSGDLFVNAELVRLGYAAAATVPPDVRNAGLFVGLAREAREAQRGLWSPSVCPDG